MVSWVFKMLYMGYEGLKHSLRNTNNSGGATSSPSTSQESVWLQVASDHLMLRMPCQVFEGIVIYTDVLDF